MADAQRQRDLLSPSTSYCVDVGCANAARVNGDVDIVVFELLEWKLRLESESCVYMGESRLGPTSCRLNVLQFPFLMSVTAKASVVSGYGMV